MGEGAGELIEQIEDAFVAQWSHFGRWPPAQLRDEDGVLWTENPITHLPYNAVLRTRVTGDADAVVARVIERYRERDVAFMWLEHPTARPDDLGLRLRAHGLEPVEFATGMSLELDEWEPRPASPLVREVRDDDDLRAYAGLIMRYWEVPPDDRPLVEDLNRYWSGGRTRGHRFIAVAEDGTTLGKGYLSLAGRPGVAAIFGMSVLPEARGRGIGAALTTAMLSRAREAGCGRAVLHSSEGAVSLYRRAGFVERCPLTVYATTPLWSDK
ncbi:MAG TPA: GNAT family N-acetyltransferase [Solirubrobacteraceae bacterium]|nr:GNAT family N-acetyltransferase [Solirubrobacteraceae bacterium]